MFSEVLLMCHMLTDEVLYCAKQENGHWRG